MYWPMWFDPARHDPQAETQESWEEAMQVSFEAELGRTLHAVEQAWRCQLGSELFAACVDCARAGLVTHEHFACLDSDMVAYTGDQDWAHNAPALVYGPALPDWHPIKRQEVDDELPF